MSQKDLKQLQKEFEKRGWRVSRTGGDHLKWKHDLGGTSYISSATPSGKRSLPNIRAGLRKIERDIGANNLNGEDKAVTAQTSTMPLRVTVSWHLLRNVYGMVISIPVDWLPKSLHDHRWKIAVTDKHLTVFQSASGTLFDKHKNVLRIRARPAQIDGWKIPYRIGRSMPYEKCPVVITRGDGDRLIFRIALPSWLKDEHAKITQPTKPSGDTQPGSATIPSGLKFLPASHRRTGPAPETETKSEPRMTTPSSPEPVPTPAPVVLGGTGAAEAQPEPPRGQNTWQDAKALCDLVNELTKSPEIAFFMKEGRLGVRRVITDEYLPE